MKALLALLVFLPTIAYSQHHQNTNVYQDDFYGARAYRERQERWEIDEINRKLDEQNRLIQEQSDKLDRQEHRREMDDLAESSGVKWVDEDYVGPLFK
jgi:hypothetical protein